MRDMHIRAMKLSEYLDAKNLTESAFGQMIGADQSTVNRLKRGQIPSAALMVKIVEATSSAVTPNDFFGVAA